MCLWHYMSICAFTGAWGVHTCVDRVSVHACTLMCVWACTRRGCVCAHRHAESTCTRLHMCVYRSMSIHMCVCVCVQVCVYLCVHACEGPCTHTCVFAGPCAHACVSVCVQVCVHTCRSVCMHTWGWAGAPGPTEQPARLTLSLCPPCPSPTPPLPVAHLKDRRLSGGTGTAQCCSARACCCMVPAWPVPSSCLGTFGSSLGAGLALPSQVPSASLRFA